MPPLPPGRRPLNLARLDAHVRLMKLRRGVELPEGRKKTVSLPRASFVPVLQVDVGGPVALMAQRYRLLIPTVQVIRESAQAIRRVFVASLEDVLALQLTFIRHFGGVTVLHQAPAPAVGVGARDPERVAESLEQNEHVAFDVYAAPVQEADDYFRLIREELEEALGEGVILIERQQVTLI
jgi:hypothetical protein